MQPKRSQNPTPNPTPLLKVFCFFTRPAPVYAPGWTATPKLRKVGMLFAVQSRESIRKPLSFCLDCTPPILDHELLKTRKKPFSTNATEPCPEYHPVSCRCFIKRPCSIHALYILGLAHRWERLGVARFSGQIRMT